MCNDPTHAALLQRRHIAPASALYVRAGDLLHLAGRSAYDNSSLYFDGYLLTPEGQIQELLYELDLPTAYSGAERFETMQEGWLLSLTATNPSTTHKHGGLYAWATIEQQDPNLQAAIYQVLGGYALFSSRPSYPSGIREAPYTGWGQLRSKAGANPAAGAEISYSVPAGVRWRLLTLRATLVTAAVAATRQVHLTIDDGTTVLLNTAANATQILSLTRNYNVLCGGVLPAATDAEIYLPLPPDLILGPGYRIKTVTTAIDAADDWGAPQLLVEEWVEG